MNDTVSTQSHGLSGGNPLLANLWIYAVAHGVVDAACTATVFSIFFRQALPLSQSFGLIVLYGVLDFGLRPVLGLAVDHYKTPRLAAALGCLIAAACALFYSRLPLTALVCAGIGNALFHVGGGGISFRITPGRASAPGIFGAPGALGLAAGTLMGKSGFFPAGSFAALLIFIALAILAIRPPAMDYELHGRKITPRYFEIILLLVMLAIALASFIGLTLAFPWKSDLRLLAALTLGIALGRGLGGIIGDRLGWVRVTVCTLLTALPLLAFGSHIPALAITGVLLFNTGVAIASTAIANVLPGRPAFAFGLVSLGLILGALPAFAGYRPIMAAPWAAAPAVLLLALLSYGGLRFYFKGARALETGSGMIPDSIATH
jgi:FSR family fosmidomycin resistance protein-like MFS transporter